MQHPLRDGTGDFPGAAARPPCFAAADAIRGVGVGDFNGDGWDDFVAACRFRERGRGPNLAIVLNNGDGNLCDTGQQGNRREPGIQRRDRRCEQ
jgi:hypothetical protein